MSPSQQLLLIPFIDNCPSVCAMKPARVPSASMNAASEASRPIPAPFSADVQSAMDDCLTKMPSTLPVGIRVRRAVASDAGSIIRLVQGLALYAKEPIDAVKMDQATLLRDGFGQEPLFFVFLVERQCSETPVWKPVGFGLFVFMYSTWEGRVMYLEDLFMVEEERRKGVGGYLFQLLAKVADAVDCARFQWMALDWNTPALDFYARLGAPLLDPAWRSLRMDRAQLKQLAATGSGHV